MLRDTPVRVYDMPGRRYTVDLTDACLSEDGRYFFGPADDKKATESGYEIIAEEAEGAVNFILLTLVPEPYTSPILAVDGDLVEIREATEYGIVCHNIEPEADGAEFALTMDDAGELLSVAL